MKIYIFIFVVLLASLTTVASAEVEVSEDWNITFDGGNNDRATSVQQVADGYIVAGYKNNSISNDMWLVKTDPTGAEDWNITFACGVTDDDIAYSVQQTSDSGFIVSGPIQYGNTRDIWLLKTDENGSEYWNVSFDSGSDDYATSIQQTSDGGYIVAGYTNRSLNWDVWLFKVNDTGSEEWNVSFDGGLEDYSRSVQQTSDGGYIVAGTTDNGLTHDLWLIKTNETGFEEWIYSFDGGYEDFGQSVQQTSDDGYIVAGYTENGDNWDMWLIKTSDAGSEVWNATFNGSVEDDGAYSVRQTSDDGYIIAGYTENADNRDMWLVKANATGSEEWNITFDGVYGHDYARSVQQTSDGDYIVAGYINDGLLNDMWLVRVNENHAPVLSIGDKTGKEKSLLTFTVVADDDDPADILNYTSDNLPTGATLDNSTGVFSWTPSSTQSGVYSVEFTVSDGSLNDSKVINITISDVRTGGSGGSSGGGGSGSSGEAFENIAFKDVKTKSIVGGLEISYFFDDEQNPIQYINFTALRNYQRVSTTIEVLKERSSMVDESAPGIVYSNVNIWVGKAGFATDDNIADPVIVFRVSNDWLTENGIDENSVTIYRHNEGKWNALDVKKIGEDDSYIYFEAETPGFSPFAIAGEVVAETLTDDNVPEEEVSVNDMEPVDGEMPATESNNIPGISILTSVFVLVFACVFWKRKN